MSESDFLPLSDREVAVLKGAPTGTLWIDRWSDRDLAPFIWRYRSEKGIVTGLAESTGAARIAAAKVGPVTSVRTMAEDCN